MGPIRRCVPCIRWCRMTHQHGHASKRIAVEYFELIVGCRSEVVDVFGPKHGGVREDEDDKILHTHTEGRDGGTLRGGERRSERQVGRGLMYVISYNVYRHTYNISSHAHVTYHHHRAMLLHSEKQHPNTPNHTTPCTLVSPVRCLSAPLPPSHAWGIPPVL